VEIKLGHLYKVKGGNVFLPIKNGSGKLELVWVKLNGDQSFIWQRSIHTGEAALELAKNAGAVEVGDLTPLKDYFND
jgi:hypothetical protein